MITKAILIYLAVGAIIYIAHPWIRAQFAGLFSPNASIGRRILETIVCIVAFPFACCIWPLALRNARKPQSVLDLLNENPAFKEMKDLHGIMDLMTAGGCDTDEIPGATGEFGLAPTNPIPTNTIFGSGSYLRRLQTAEGHPVQNERLGSTSTDGMTSPLMFTGSATKTVTS